MTVSCTDPNYQRQYYKNYREANKERIAETKHAYYMENRTEILAESRQRFADGRHRYWDLRNEVYDKLGRVCKQCGFSDIRALQFDGINGGDSKLRKEYGSRWLRYILDHLDQFQTLCANCNWIKKHERGEVGRVGMKF
jgi:hypothetical protein